MSEPASGLQFDRAEFEGGTASAASCAACQQPLTDAYYEVGGAVTCEGCKRRIEAEWNQPSDFGARAGRFARAFVFGLGAAAAGCGLYYAVLAISGYHLGLIAIVVGLMVGNAVSKGARGRGGWLYQLLAIVLTYTAIVLSFIPDALKTLPPPEGEGMLEAVVRGIAVVAIVYVAPVLGGVGILGGLIIVFGLYEAWKLNRKATLQITGPYSLAARVEPPPAPIGG